MLENITLKDLNQIIKLIGKDENNSSIENGEDIKIIILQRGWVIVGRFYKQGHNCWIENGYVIRQWGTTSGLGELALEGKKEHTKLDEIPKTEFHELTIVASIICDKEKWKNICK